MACFDTMNDLLTPMFQQTDILKVCGLSAVTLQNWNARGFGRPSVPQKVGTGHRRIYSAFDVITLSMMERLTALKLPVSFAWELAKEIVAPIVDGQKSPNDPPKLPVDQFCILYPTGDEREFRVHWHFAEDDRPALPPISKPWQGGYIVIPVSQIISHLMTELEQLPKAEG